MGAAHDRSPMTITSFCSRIGIIVALGTTPVITFGQSTAGISNIRPVDQGNVGVFEPPKTDTTPFHGLHVTVGAAFTQQWQGLQHADSVAKANTVVNGVPEPVQLVPIGHGFNNAVANMYLNAELDTGMRVSMQVNLSSRHHEDAWVNDGYLLIDHSPIDNPVLREIMKYTTVRVGDFELDYGDTHFMRTDNGNAMYNPLVGNPIMDAYTTEIGAEVYVRANGFLAMISPTGGEIHGQVTNPRSGRSPGTGSSDTTRSWIPTSAFASRARSTRRTARPATRCSPATAKARATTT